jgi:hypothetical protein
MQTNQNLLNTRRQEIRILIDKITYTRDAHTHDEIREQLREAIAEARHVLRILSASAH